MSLPKANSELEERLAAFRLHHGIDVPDVPLHVIAEPIDLCRSTEDAALLIERCDALAPVEIIVIDTLSRAMSGGNENAPDDMGKFVGNCDRLRLATGAHVLVIHHSGKDDARGARGHSLLRAAADTEIEVSKDESALAAAKVVKQRDHRIGNSFAFKLLPVEIGRDEDDQPVTSCVVEAADAPSARPVSKQARLPPAAQTALRALAEAITDGGKHAPASIRVPATARVVSMETWRQCAYRFGISGSDEKDARQKAFKRASEQLIATGRVGFDDGKVWLDR